MRSWGVNTDDPRYVKQTGKAMDKGTTPATVKTPAADPQSVEKIVSRLRLTVPVLNHTRTDQHLRAVLLS